MNRAEMVQDHVAGFGIEADDIVRGPVGFNVRQRIVVVGFIGNLGIEAGETARGSVRIEVSPSRARTRQAGINAAGQNLDQAGLDGRR